MRITVVDPGDLPELLPLMRACCDFYQVDPGDQALLELSHSAARRPAREGLQLLARDDSGGAVGSPCRSVWLTAAGAVHGPPIVMVWALGLGDRGSSTGDATPPLVVPGAGGPGGGTRGGCERFLGGVAALPPGPAHEHPGQVASPSAPLPTPAPGRQATPEGPPFVTSVSPNGRYFLDQYGRPLLLHGDSPWALMTRLSPQQARLWFADRQTQGFNAAIISLIGATANGAPSDDGATFDGLLPFVDGDVLQWQEPYWERVTAYLRMAAEHGITVMLYPIDGWTIGHSFVPRSIDAVPPIRRQGGAALSLTCPTSSGCREATTPSASEDPARGSDVDHCIDAMMRGIREAGDGRPFSMQFESAKSISTDNPYWARRVDWNFVYTYYPTYKAVLDAYRRQPAIPAVLGEANYEGENNQPETPPTTDETLRRQVLWALTSGAAGEFFGSDDWDVPLTGGSSGCRPARSPRSPGCARCSRRFVVAAGAGHRQSSWSPPDAARS